MLLRFLPLIWFDFLLSIPWHSDIFYIFKYFIIHIHHKPFCFQSGLWIHFSASFWLLWGCAGQYIVGHLFLLSYRSTLFILPERVHCMQTTDRFLLLFMWLGFSTSSVNTLSTYCCWGRFLFLVFFWIMVVFFLSSIRVWLLFVSIY